MRDGMGKHTIVVVAAALASGLTLSGCGPSRAAPDAVPVSSTWGGPRSCYTLGNRSTEYDRIARDCLAQAGNAKIPVEQALNSSIQAGAAQVNLGRYEDAVNTLRSVLTQPAATQLQSDEARYYLARAHAAFGSPSGYASALQYLDEIILRNRADTRALLAQADIYARRNGPGDADKSLTSLYALWTTAQGALSVPGLTPDARREKQEFETNVRGRLQQVALAVGAEAMSGPRAGTRTETDRAISALEKARETSLVAGGAAAPEAALSLARAQLRMAGLVVRPEIAQYEARCIAGIGDAEGWLRKALNTLQGGLAVSSQRVVADSYRGCALRGMGGIENLRDAASAYRAALSGSNNPAQQAAINRRLGDTLKMLAGEQFAAWKRGQGDRMTAEATLEDAVASYKLAVGDTPSDNAEVYLEIADAQSVLARTDEQHCYLVRALQQNPGYSPALARHGQFHFDAAFNGVPAGGQGCDVTLTGVLSENGKDNVAIAEANFRKVEEATSAPTASESDVALNATAMLYLSKISIQKATRNGNDANVDRAVFYAEKAMERVKNQREDYWEFLEQSCLVQIRKGGAPTQLAMTRCINNGERTPDALLLRGMFYLRQAQMQGIAQQLQTYQLAKTMFGDGQDALQRLGSRDPDMRAKFEVGFAAVDHCLRQEVDAQKRLEALEPNARKRVLALYDLYYANRC